MSSGRDAHADSEMLEVAKSAIKTFKAMIPSFENFATAAAGRPMKVHLSSKGTYSDKDGNLHVRPPYALGSAESDHVRTLCGERDEQGFGLCPACRKREIALSSVMHEASHCIFGSFDLVDASAHDRMSDEAQAIIRPRTRSSSDYAQHLANSISPFFMQIVNALEDVRIENSMGRLRPGISDMNIARAYVSLDEVPWGEYDLNAQAPAAALVYGKGMDIAGYFDEYVEQSILSPEVSRIIDRTNYASSISDVYVLAAEFFVAMLKLGFFLSEEDGETREKMKRESGSEEGEGSKSEGTSVRSDSGGSVQRSGTDEQDPSSSGNDQSGEDGGAGGDDREGPDSEWIASEVEPGGDNGHEGGGVSGGPSQEKIDAVAAAGRTDELKVERPDDSDFGMAGHASKHALETMMGHAQHDRVTPESLNKEERAVASVAETYDYFDSPSSVISRVDIKKKWGYSRSREIDVSESIIGHSLLLLRKALEKNRRSDYSKNLKSGRVDASRLGRRAWSDDGRLFHKKNVPGKRDYAVLIGIDISGSTGGGALQVELKAAHAQAELCYRSGIKFAIYAHTGGYSSLDIYQVKTFGDPWNAQTKDRLSKLSSKSANLDGHTLEFYRKELDKVRATDKILMYYSDGAMPMENYNEELAILKREIKVCERKGYILMAVGVDSSDPIKYGMDTVVISSERDVPKVVEHLGRRLREI